MTSVLGSEICFKNVGKTYGQQQVVSDINLTIRAGEFFSLLGPSGSGKTTTLMMLAGFTDTSSGEILVDGKDVSKLPPQKRGFGMVFQNYAIFPHMNVFDNVAFPLRARGMSRADIEEKVMTALQAVRLDHLADRYSRQLSGGQQQRVAIARAISFEPRVVLMDEPLGALDKNLRYAMQTEIKDLQQRLGMTVVYVTHDQEEAMNMSDRIAIMNNGRLEHVAPPRDVYERPSSRFVGQFLGEANIAEGLFSATSPGKAHIGCGALRLSAGDFAPHIPNGTKAAWFIRPEKIQLFTPDNNVQGISGRIIRQSFLGNITRYKIALSDDVKIIADQTNTGSASYTSGDQVTVFWNPADARVLTE